MASVGYVPGSLTAVAGESCLALVEAAPDSPAAAWIWQQAGQGASAQALLAGLLGAAFEGVGGFTLLDRPAAGPLRLFCRGAVAATVVSGTAVGGTIVGGTVLDGTVVDGTTAGGTEASVAVSARIDGVGLLTWREHVVAADAERIYLGQPPDDGAVWLPAAAGVLLAGCVIVELAETAPPAAPPPGVLPVAHPAAGRSDTVSSGAGDAGAGSSGAGSVDAVNSRGAHSDAGRSSVVDSDGNGPGAGSAVQDSPDVGAAVRPPAQPDAAEVADPAGAPDRPTDADTRADVDVPGPPAPDGWFQPAGASHDSAAPSSAPGPDTPPPIAGPWDPPSGSSNGNWATPPPDGGPDPTAAPPVPEGADGLSDAVSWGAGPGAPAAPLPQRSRPWSSRRRLPWERRKAGSRPSAPTRSRRRTRSPRTSRP